MGIVKLVADHFKTATPTHVDRYGILSPLLASGDYITSTSEIYALFKNSVYTNLMMGKTKTDNGHVLKAMEAYRDYVKALPSHDQSTEKAEPFSTIIAALTAIGGNIAQIEDNFQTLFGDIASDKPEASLRSSSLVVMGYLEEADVFATWLANLTEHMTANDDDMIPPFRTKELINKAAGAGQFAGFNLNKWNPTHGSFLSEVKEMQNKGADVAVQSDGMWIDQFAHDSQFSSIEQNLISASLRSPIMMAMTLGHVKVQEKIDLLTTRKEWVTAKIVLEQAKLRGLHPDSPEYRKLKKVTDNYANLASKLEQKIERMRS
jgi:uncharacterized protein with HEPN domain